MEEFGPDLVLPAGQDNEVADALSHLETDEEMIFSPAEMAEKFDMVMDEEDPQWSFPLSAQTIAGLQQQDDWLLNQLKTHPENFSRKT